MTTSRTIAPTAPLRRRRILAGMFTAATAAEEDA